MQPLRTLSLRASTIVDQWGYLLADPTDRSVLGHQPIPDPIRLVYALETNQQSGLTRRYQPSFAPGEDSFVGMDFSSVVPLGIGLAAPDPSTLEIFTNTVPRQPVFTAAANTGLFSVGPINVRDKMLYARIVAADQAEGTDFQFWWSAVDTNGNIWPRTALLLVAATS